MRIKKILIVVIIVKNTMYASRNTSGALNYISTF